jgi:hypothetical protein
MIANKTVRELAVSNHRRRKDEESRVLIQLHTIKSFFLIHVFICAYIVLAISPLCLPPSPLPSTPLLRGRSCSALFSNFAEE